MKEELVLECLYVRVWLEMEELNAVQRYQKNNSQKRWCFSKSSWRCIILLNFFLTPTSLMDSDKVVSVNASYYISSRAFYNHSQIG